jgi:hypothetical protein
MVLSTDATELVDLQGHSPSLNLRGSRLRPRLLCLPLLHISRGGEGKSREEEHKARLDTHLEDLINQTILEELRERSGW